MTTPHSLATPVYIHACGSHSALGNSKASIQATLAQGYSANMQASHQWLNDGSQTIVGQVSDPLPSIEDDYPHQNTRNNRLALSALQQIEQPIRQAIAQYGADRVAVIVGTSTSGISDGEQALLTMQSQDEPQKLPENYHYQQQEMANTSRFIANYFSLQGPAYTISTACSSSGRVFLSAKRLLKAGMVDAVIVGGCDTLCKLTLNGFYALEALSHNLCNPFSDNRDGINIGEAAAFMLLSLNKPKQNEPCVALLGVGDSSDAHHISAPHPEGNGAEQAMLRALDDAQLQPLDIGYINAHGTATPLNDAMEAKAIFRIFADNVPVSSTKPFTGHTLGAASAIEAALCWQILSDNLPLPAQIHDGQRSEFNIQLARPNSKLTQAAILSNSFAFGGNNISLIFGYPND